MADFCVICVMALLVNMTHFEFCAQYKGTNHVKKLQIEQ